MAAGWVRGGAAVRLRIESGKTRDGAAVGVPFGYVPRLILLHLRTEAIKTRSREVELGRSMHGWPKAMGLNSGGKGHEAVRGQGRRLSLCRLTFDRLGEGGDAVLNGGFVREAILPGKGEGGGGAGQQRPLWRETVVLDEVFYESLIRHPLPVRESAIRALSGRSMAIDLYVRLAYRPRHLARPARVPWPALHRQFGAGFAQPRQFRAHARDALYGGAGNDRLHGDAGNDTLEGFWGGDFLSGGDGDDALWGDAIAVQSPRLLTNAADYLSGGAGNDQLNGGGGDDNLGGGVGDVIDGWSGADVLTGGAGADRFLFGSGISGALYAASGRDTITDFGQGDVIDLSRVMPDEAFTFIGQEPFSGTGRPEVRFTAAAEPCWSKSMRRRPTAATRRRLTGRRLGNRTSSSWWPGCPRSTPPLSSCDGRARPALNS